MSLSNSLLPEDPRESNSISGIDTGDDLYGIEKDFVDFRFVVEQPLRIAKFEATKYQIEKQLLVNLLTNNNELGGHDGIELSFGICPADQAKEPVDRFEVHLFIRGLKVLDGEREVDNSPAFSTYQEKPTTTTIKIRTQPTNRSEEQA